ncbi:MAG: NAD-dependent epimerase/dehydratase family protein [Bacteroidetes bacterium]|nr:MAG: NAD-dependent epimerase/dehydratase family protein [Bacteroidota bacterium]
MRKDTILIIGASGQLGTVLTQRLQEVFGTDRVVTSDVRPPVEERGIFEPLDVLDRKALADLIRRYDITQIYHLAAILSAKGEQNPLLTWQVNMDGWLNVLQVARESRVEKVYFPSSIAVFGPETPRRNTPQFTVLSPTTVYGMSKVAGEHWARYYAERYGLDVRSLRYPGVIGYQSMPGGGTTDYAVDIFHKAILGERFTCFLKEDTVLPMIYMDDAIRATLELMEAPKEKIKIRTSYNLAGVSFSPAEVAFEIRKHIPGFDIYYEPDFRQQIADSWPESIDDSCAREDWGWAPKYDLAALTRDMLFHLGEKYKVRV